MWRPKLRFGTKISIFYFCKFFRDNIFYLLYTKLCFINQFKRKDINCIYFPYKKYIFFCEGLNKKEESAVI